MTLAAVRDQIKTVLEGVSGVGKVHDYERHAKDWSAFFTLFLDADNKINGWEVSRYATPSAAAGRGVFERRHNFRLRGYYGLSDSAASEKTFQDLVEAVVTALQADQRLGGTTWKSGPVQVAAVEPRIFGSVLCHYAELTVEVWEEASYG